MSSDFMPMEDEDPELFVNPVLAAKMQMKKDRELAGKRKGGKGTGKSGGLRRLNLGTFNADGMAPKKKTAGEMRGEVLGFLGAEEGPKKTVREVALEKGVSDARFNRRMKDLRKGGGHIGGVGQQSGDDTKGVQMQRKVRLAHLLPLLPVDGCGWCGGGQQGGWVHPPCWIGWVHPTRLPAGRRAEGSAGEKSARLPPHRWRRARSSDRLAARAPAQDGDKGTTKVGAGGRQAANREQTSQSMQF